MFKPTLPVLAKTASVVMVASVLAIAACSQIEPQPKQAVQPVASESQASEKAPVVLRTAEVFDTNKYKGKFTIHYFYLEGKVAMGDCALITTPDGKTMMIDAGVKESSKQILQYLDKLGVKTIDIALNTHPHTDHLGGYPVVLLAKDVKAYYKTNHNYTESARYNDTMSEVNKKKIPITILEEGNVFKLGDEVSVEVLAPYKGMKSEDVKSNEASVLNQFSSVFKISYKDTSFLFNGDIYKETEMNLTDKFGQKLDSDFMTMPHHGNNTSSAPAYINAVSPKITIASANIFNSLAVYQRYKSAGSQAYSTGLNGNIVVVSDGKSINVVTEKDSSLDKPKS
jgi:competence protein ComEC